MKSQKGVTLMILMATVVIMAIVAGTINYNTKSAVKTNEYYSMCADIELLDEKIALYYLQNNSLPITGEPIGLENICNDEAVRKENENPNNSNKIYRIDIGKLDNLSLTNSEYFIDEQSHTIYYLYGVTFDNYTYYTVPLDYQKVELSNYQ